MPTMINKFLKLFVFGAIAIQVMVSLSHIHWFFELFSHYRLYYVILGLILTVILMARNHWKSALIITVLVAMNLAPLAPYLGPTQTGEEGDLKIYSQNVFYLNPDISEFRTIIQEEDPDVFIIHEANKEWTQEANFYIEEYPYQAFTKNAGVSGIFIASKIPGEFQEIEHWMLFTPDNFSTSILGVHPFAPINGRLAKGRNKEFISLASFLLTQDSIVVLGDYNSTPWSPHFQKLLQISDLQDARIGFGLIPTWHANSILFNIPIDHALISHDVEVADFRTTTKTSSDHLGIILEIR